MNWTNPLLYVLGFTVLTTFGAISWKIFWWVAKADAAKRDFRAFTKEIRDDIKRILLRLNPILEGHSPFRLNELGRTIAAELDAASWAADLAPSLLPDVAGQRPSEIDNFCYEYVNHQPGDEWSDRLADAAFEHGVDRDAVRSVLWIVLREELLRPAADQPSESDASGGS